MKRKNTLTTKNVESLEKIASEIKSMRDRVYTLKTKAYQIENNHKWINYTSESMFSNLTEDERRRVCDAFSIIRYAEQIVSRA
jgi:hypothetical protein